MAKSICSVPGCDHISNSRGWCKSHYGRWLAKGDVLAHIPLRPLKPPGLSMEETFRYWMPGEPPPPGVVWPWCGMLDSNGYGRLFYGGGSMLAHRAAYEIFCGPIPTDLIIRHKNDTPCDVNPWNLEVGTRADNSDDKVARSRQARGPSHGLRGVGHPNSLLSESDVLEMRRAFDSGEASYNTLAARYSISRSNVSLIINRKAWKHI